MKAAGTAGDGVVWVMGAAAWNSDVARHEARPRDRQGRRSRRHLPAGALRSRRSAPTSIMTEAMEWAAKNGGITGPNIKAGHVREEGLDAGRPGGRLPEGDMDARGPSRRHRRCCSTRASSRATAGRCLIAQLMADGTIGMKKVYETRHPAQAGVARLVEASGPRRGAMGGDRESRPEATDTPEYGYPRSAAEPRRRCSRSTTSRWSTTTSSSSCAASASRCRRGRSSPCSAPTVPASRPR